MRAAVVGAGPAGFYTAQALLKRFPNCTVDILERLPVPFGLVRYGVAPDHPATKNVMNQFTKLVNENRQRLNFYGNVTVGPNHAITTHQLNQYYDLSIYATGAAHPRSLSIPLPSRRVHSANDFVLWLNAHPDAYHSTNGPTIAERIEADLTSATDIAIVGVGNVAIDIARILLRPVDDFRNTDISTSALDLLAQSNVSSVTLLGRKNPARAAWTTPALREVVTKIPGIVTACDHDLVKHDLQQADLPRRKTSALKILAERTVDYSLLPSYNSRNSKLLRLEFLRSPTQFSLTNNTVTMHLSSRLSHPENEQPDYQLSSTVDPTEHDAVFLSLGYVGNDFTGLSVGWAHGKASGIIADNKWDAESVVSQIPPKPSPQSTSVQSGPPEWLSSQALEVVTWEGWLRIDEEERRRATTTNRPLSRVKIQSVSEMLEVANAAVWSTADIPSDWKLYPTRVD